MSTEEDQIMEIDVKTLKFLLKQKGAAGLIGVYVICMQLVHHKIDGHPITMKRLAKYCGFSTKLFVRRRNRLRSYNLIEVETTRHGFITRTQITTKTINGDPTHSPRVASRTCARDLSKNFPSSPFPPKGEGKGDGLGDSCLKSKKITKSKLESKSKLQPLISIAIDDASAQTWQYRCARKLYRMLARRRKIMTREVHMSSWLGQFTRLHHQGYSKRHINTVLSWYCLHFGDDFVPDARSASTFLQKFARIEAAMERDAKQDGDTTEIRTTYIDDDFDGDQDNPIVSEDEFDIDKLGSDSFIGA